MLKEGALPRLNLPRESASSTTKPRLSNAIEKREEDQLLQEQMPHNFTSRIKSLALRKRQSFKFYCESTFILPDSHELIQSYDISFNNVTLSEVSFFKHVLPKVFDYFDYKTADLEQPVFQDKYFRTKNCSLSLLSPENTYKICDKKNIKFKTEVNSNKVSLAKPAHLNAPVKLTSPEKIKLTLQ